MYLKAYYTDLLTKQIWVLCIFLVTANSSEYSIFCAEKRDLDFVLFHRVDFLLMLSFIKKKHLKMFAEVQPPEVPSNLTHSVIPRACVYVYKTSWS